VRGNDWLSIQIAVTRGHGGGGRFGDTAVVLRRRSNSADTPSLPARLPRVVPLECSVARCRSARPSVCHRLASALWRSMIVPACPTNARVCGRPIGTGPHGMARCTTRNMQALRRSTCFSLARRTRYGFCGGAQRNVPTPSPAGQGRASRPQTPL
jgi:hypothetical protein